MIRDAAGVERILIAMKSAQLVTNAPLAVQSLFCGEVALCLLMSVLRRSRALAGPGCSILCADSHRGMLVGWPSLALSSAQASTCHLPLVSLSVFTCLRTIPRMFQKFMQDV